MVDAVVFKNNASSRLAINVAAASITVTLEAGTGVRFPAPGADEFFPLVVKDERTGQFEIMYCTQRINDICTVDRAQEGTTAQDWLMGASAWSTATAGVFTTYFNYAWSQAAADARFVNVSGDVMVGALTLPGDPTIAKHATTKEWVEAQIAAVTSLTEAPNNGMIYGRKSLGWTTTIERADYLTDQAAIATAQSGQDLRLDNIDIDLAALFTTKLDDAPIDGLQYIRQDGSWNVLTAALTDAPADGDKYVRKDNLWLGLTPGVMLTDIKTVDGAGSGLDADLLDGQQGAWYQDRANHTGSQAQATVTNLVADLALKAPLASPALTGTPTAPTAAPGTNTTQLATTAFATVALALKADLASPTFTGDPKAPTPATADNDTSIATTAHVQAAIAAKAVRYDAAQALTAGQKLQAQSNIGGAGQHDLRYNRIINPSMQESQENGNTGGTTNAYFAADQWSFQRSNDGVQTFARVALTTPAGAINRLRVTVGTIDAALAAGQYAYIGQALEGSRMADFFFGSASAKPGVIRLGMKFPAGTYGVSLQNAAADRSYVAEVVISAGEANTNVIKEVAFVGDTTGTWPTGDVLGWNLGICIASGTTLQGVTGWQAGSKITTANQTNGLSSVANVFELFDVGLRLDENSIGAYGVFEVPDLAVNKLQCQRYFEKWAEANGHVSVGSGFAASTSSARINWQYDVEKRAAPVVTGSVAANTFGALFLASGSTTFVFSSAVSTGKTSAVCAFAGSAVLTAGQGIVMLISTGGGYMQANARM